MDDDDVLGPLRPIEILTFLLVLVFGSPVWLQPLVLLLKGELTP